MNLELEKEFPISAEDRVIEECAELIQALGKAKRFGWFSHHPDRETDNFEEVWIEVQDVRAALVRLELELAQVNLERRV